MIIACTFGQQTCLHERITLEMDVCVSWGGIACSLSRREGMFISFVRAGGASCEAGQEFQFVTVVEGPQAYLNFVCSPLILIRSVLCPVQIDF